MNAKRFIHTAMAFGLALPLAARGAEDATDGVAIDGLSRPQTRVLVPQERRHLNAAVDVIELAATELVAPPPRDDGEFGEPKSYGFVEPAPAGLLATPNWTEATDGKYWTLELQAAGAKGLRVKLNGDFGRDGVELRVYDPVSGAAFGPYSKPRRDENGDWWTTVIFGESIGLEFHAPEGVANPKLPEIHAIARLTEDFGGAPAGVGCTHNDITCSNTFLNHRRAVCFMTYVADGGANRVCTGSLLNRTPNDGAPLLLTADHCVNTQSEANTVAAIWFFETPSCNGTPPNANTLPRNDGTLLLKRRANSDMSFLGLIDPPQGDFWLGWDSGGWTLQSDAVGIHHPAGTFKRISDGDVTAALWVTYGLNNAHVWRVDWDNGSTEGGSSGSPILDTSGRVRGQLKGGVCNRGDYGRFGVSFDTLDPYIHSVASPVWVEDGAGGDERGTSGDPFNSVFEATFCVVAGDEVRIRAGNYDESFTIWRPMLLTSSGGSAVIGN